MDSKMRETNGPHGNGILDARERKVLCTITNQEGILR